MRRLLFSLLILLCFLLPLQRSIRERSQVSVLDEDSNESEAFRRQLFSDEVLLGLVEEGGGDGEKLARLAANALLKGGFRAQKSSLLKEDLSGALFMKYKPEIYKSFLESCQAIWADVEYFPVGDKEAFYEDGWGTPREYGGKRRHEGCDIFGKKEIAGYYPVISMTAGQVEQVGWLPLGGYRIGIRSPHGGYFYYAHLSSYDREFQKGDKIQAGDILGFMGNTGYGTIGTSGKFPVHLHLGIYIKTAGTKELSVNPYWVLRAVEEKRLVYGS